MGCVTQVGEQALNVGRGAVLVAGWPETVCATTVDRQCGSSLQTAFNAASAMQAGHLDLVVAAGVEHMTRVPDGLEPRRRRLGRGEREDRRALADRAAGNLGRGHRGGVGAHARGARRVLARVASPRRRRDRRGQVRERDRPDRGRSGWRGRSLRRRRDAATRHVAREARIAAARVQGRRSRHRRELELDRRRLGGDARSRARPPSLGTVSSRERASSRSGSRASIRTGCSTGTPRHASARSRRPA